MNVGKGWKESEKRIFLETLKESAKTAMSGRSTQIFSSTFNVLDVGGGDGSRAKETFPFGSIVTIDKQSGWDIDEKGLPEGDWDYIFANHIIEHLIYPDRFLIECKGVMQKHTILEIGTPNLTAWFNRIFFLFGYIPHSVELSRQFNVGKPFNWNNERLGGHVYVYTIPALLQLLKKHGFRIIEVKGECSTFNCWKPILWLDKLLTKLNPNLASAFRIKCMI